MCPTRRNKVSGHPCALVMCCIVGRISLQVQSPTVSHILHSEPHALFQNEYFSKLAFLAKHPEYKSITTSI